MLKFSTSDQNSCYFFIYWWVPIEIEDPNWWETASGTTWTCFYRGH